MPVFGHPQDLSNDAVIDDPSVANTVNKNAVDIKLLDQTIGERGYTQNVGNLHAISLLPSRKASPEAQQALCPDKPPSDFKHLGARLSLKTELGLMVRRGSRRATKDGYLQFPLGAPTRLGR